MRAFINLAGFYRRIMQNFGEIAAPLSSLLRKGQSFLWTDAQQQSFDNLKRILVNPVCLKYPEPGSLMSCTRMHQM
jgi:hypothetical protein